MATHRRAKADRSISFCSFSTLVVDKIGKTELLELLELNMLPCVKFQKVNPWKSSSIWQGLRSGLIILYYTVLILTILASLLT